MPPSLQEAHANNRLLLVSRVVRSLVTVRTRLGCDVKQGYTPWKSPAPRLESLQKVNHNEKTPDPNLHCLSPPHDGLPYRRTRRARARKTRASFHGDCSCPGDHRASRSCSPLKAVFWRTHAPRTRALHTIRLVGSMFDLIPHLSVVPINRGDGFVARPSLISKGRFDSVHIHSRHSEQPTISMR